jgi:hypothetical protein
LLSTVPAFGVVELAVPAFWVACWLRLVGTVAFFFVSAGLGFGEGLLLAFGWRCGFFAFPEIGFGACIEAMSPDLASKGLRVVIVIVGKCSSVAGFSALPCVALVEFGSGF